VLNKTVTEHRAVLVTGATSGIGEASAFCLARAGFRVFGGVFPGEDAGKLHDAGCETVARDVTKKERLAAARESIAERLGGVPLWGLVNDAGVVSAGAVELHDIDEARYVFEVNVLGVLAASQTFLPSIREARGRIVNISSLSGLLAVPFLGPYNASKAAVESLSDTMRREVGPLGVDVIAIQPGTTRTPLWDKAEQIDLTPYEGTAYERPVNTVRNKAIGKGRRGQPPERVAGAVLEALTADPAPARIRVQKKRSSDFLYSLLPLLSDRFIDRQVRQQVWSK